MGGREYSDNITTGEVEFPDGSVVIPFNGDPNGSLTRPAGALCLDYTTPLLWRSLGGGNWEPVGVVTQTAIGDATATITPPNNLLADNNDLMDGSTTGSVTAPVDGDYILEISFIISSTVLS